MHISAYTDVQQYSLTHSYTYTNIYIYIYIYIYMYTLTVSHEPILTYCWHTLTYTIVHHTHTLLYIGDRRINRPILFAYLFIDNPCIDVRVACLSAPLPWDGCGYSCFVPFEAGQAGPPHNTYNGSFLGYVILALSLPYSPVSENWSRLHWAVGRYTYCILPFSQTLCLI